MATNDILRTYGTSFIFADVTDFPASGVGPPTTAANDIRIGATSGATVSQIDLTAIATGVARESSKIDLGATGKGHEYMLSACLEFASAPTDGEVVDFYWAGSPNPTAAEGNPGGLTGSDADVTDTAGILGQLTYIGSMTLRANVINISDDIGTFVPKHRYGMLLVINQATPAMNSAGNMDETHIIMTELIDQVQAAV